MLTIDQIEEFKRNGVLTLRHFFSVHEMSTWRSEVLEYYDHPETVSDWEESLKKHPRSKFKLSNDPRPDTHPKLAAILANLNPNVRWTGHNGLIVSRPQPSTPWLGARVPHLDFPVGQPVCYLVNTVFYLADVQNHGGAFMYWPGSHITSWQHFVSHPLDYMSYGSRTQDQTFEIIASRMEDEPVEFVGDAGDLLIWHHFLLHSGSINTTSHPRLAMFGRWGPTRTKGREDFDFQGDLWQAWHFQATELPIERSA